MGKKFKRSKSFVKNKTKKFSERKKGKKVKKVKVLPSYNKEKIHKEYEPFRKELTEEGDKILDDEDEEASAYKKLLNKFGVDEESDEEDEEKDAIEDHHLEENNEDDGDGEDFPNNEDDKDDSDNKMKLDDDDDDDDDNEVPTEDEDAEVEVEENEEETNCHTDPFHKHFDGEIEEENASTLLKSLKYQDATTQNTSLGMLSIKLPHLTTISSSTSSSSSSSSLLSSTLDQKDLKQCYVNNQLLSQVSLCNIKLVQPFTTSYTMDPTFDCMSNEQHVMFNIINSYKDFYYHRQLVGSVEYTRLVYCLHLLNHMFKSRRIILRHNNKLKSKKDQMIEYRDQGFTRPKVLIVVPFRSCAFKIINMIISLMSTDKIMVSHEDRFRNEYGSHGDDDVKKGFKPDDYEKTFDGNIDDNFKIGLSICKKTLKLYVDFYASDVIITSPLGLKTIIDPSQGNKGDVDFLSSIEILIIDQAHIFLMQNWSDVMLLVSSLNKQPTQPHGVDFSRVRMSSINGWSSLYRQTIILSAYQTPEINSLFNKFSTNYEGKCMIQPAPTSGTICNIISTLPQTFRKFQVDNVQGANEARFNYFTTKILPEYHHSTCQHVLIFISSYYDFVRVRNFMKKEDMDFTHICEYTDDKGVSRARQLFFQGRIRFLLYTERFHFYHRYRLRGIQHLFFYDLPINCHFYSEICNMILDNKRHRSPIDQSCTVLYNKYDVIKLVGVVGEERASLMIQAHRDAHLLMSGDS